MMRWSDDRTGRFPIRRTWRACRGYPVRHPGIVRCRWYLIFVFTNLDKEKRVLTRISNCPLCGARITPCEWLAAAEALLDPELGVLLAHCPRCQGTVEIRPVDDRLELGYRQPGDRPRFDVAMRIEYPELRVEASGDTGRLVLDSADGHWEFICTDD